MLVVVAVVVVVVVVFMRMCYQKLISYSLLANGNFAFARERRNEQSGVAPFSQSPPSIRALPTPLAFNASYAGYI